MLWVKSLLILRKKETHRNGLNIIWFVELIFFIILSGNSEYTSICENDYKHMLGKWHPVCLNWLCRFLACFTFSREIFQKPVKNEKLYNHIPSGEKLDFLYRNLYPLLLTNMWHGKRIYVELRLKMSCLHPNFLRHYSEYGPKKQFLRSIISSLQWQVFTPCVCTFNYTRLGLAIGIYKQISKHRIHMKTDEFYFRTKDGKNSDQINFHS